MSWGIWKEMPEGRWMQAYKRYAERGGWIDDMQMGKWEAALHKQQYKTLLFPLHKMYESGMQTLWWKQGVKNNGISEGNKVRGKGCLPYKTRIK